MSSNFSSEMPQDARSLRTLKTRRKVLPGQPGTKKLLKQYGENLLCVRYRYDTTHHRMVKTVELIFDEHPWQPAPPQISPETWVSIQVDYGERTVGIQVKAAGGIWNPEKKVWEIPYKQVVELGLTDRLVSQEGQETAPP